MSGWLLFSLVGSYVTVFALGCVARWVWDQWKAIKRQEQYRERHPK